MKNCNRLYWLKNGLVEAINVVTRRE